MNVEVALIKKSHAIALIIHDFMCKKMEIAYLLW
jgi:hypothetical protein